MPHISSLGYPVTPKRRLTMSPLSPNCSWWYLITMNPGDSAQKTMELKFASMIQRVNALNINADPRHGLSLEGMAYGLLFQRRAKIVIFSFLNLKHSALPYFGENSEWSLLSTAIIDSLLTNTFRLKSLCYGDSFHWFETGSLSPFPKSNIYSLFTINFISFPLKRSQRLVFVVI